jgi:probable rRNA maturation factor
VALSVEIAAEVPLAPAHRKRLTQAVLRVLTDAGIREGEVSIAIVDDERMHELNRQYLNHDYPTDVLSFVLEQDEAGKHLDGQIIASAAYAAREAARYGWEAEDELLLYSIHAALHLVGHDDHEPEGQQAMRAAEAKYLAEFGLTHRF